MVKNEANGEGRESRKFLMVGKKITWKKNQGYGTLFGETKDKQVSNLP